MTSDQLTTPFDYGSTSTANMFGDEYSTMVSPRGYAVTVYHSGPGEVYLVIRDLRFFSKPHTSDGKISTVTSRPLSRTDYRDIFQTLLNGMRADNFAEKYFSIRMTEPQASFDPNTPRLFNKIPVPEGIGIIRLHAPLGLPVNNKSYLPALTDMVERVVQRSHSLAI